MTYVGPWLGALGSGHCAVAFARTVLGQHSLELRAHWAFLTPHD